MPELEEPSYITPAQGLAFLAQLAQMRNRDELAAEKLRSQMYISEQKHEFDMERAQNQAQHYSDVLTEQRNRDETRRREWEVLHGMNQEAKDAEANLVDQVGKSTAPAHTSDWRDDVGKALVDNLAAANTPGFKFFQRKLDKEKDPTLRSAQITLDGQVEEMGFKKADINRVYSAMDNPELYLVYEGDPKMPQKTYIDMGKEKQVVTTMVPDPKNLGQQIPVQQYIEVPRLQPVDMDKFNKIKQSRAQLWGDSPPPALEAKPTAQIPVITTQAQYDALPSKTPFIFNGRRGIKP